jgi:hypothetical protein
VQHEGGVAVNGQAVSRRWMMGWSGTVVGSDFKFTVEPVGFRLS